MFSNAKTTNFIIKVLTEKIDILLLAIPLIFCYKGKELFILYVS